MLVGASVDAAIFGGVCVHDVNLLNDDNTTMFLILYIMNKIILNTMRIYIGLFCNFLIYSKNQFINKF